MSCEFDLIFAYIKRYNPMTFFEMVPNFPVYYFPSAMYIFKNSKFIEVLAI